MRFSGVTINLITPDKHVSPVAEEKDYVYKDVSLQCLRTSIYYGSGASD